MEDQEQPRDDDTGEWAYQLQLEQRYFQEESENVQSRQILE